MTKTNTNKCPICGKQADPKYYPFCSKRCADLDLGRWLKGTYVVHTQEIPTEEEIPVEVSVDTNE